MIDHFIVIIIASMTRFGVAIASKWSGAHAYDAKIGTTRYHIGKKYDTWHLVRRYGERYGAFLAYVPAAAYHGLTWWLVLQTVGWIVAASFGWKIYKVKWGE